MGSTITPRDWREFQHYRDRRPPWIKLHRELLNDPAFMGLPLAAKGFATMLWLLACESQDGTVSAKPEYIAFRLRMTAREAGEQLKSLADSGLFLFASDVLADASGEQAVAPRSPSPSPSPSASLLAREEDVSEQTWADWCRHRKAKRATVTATVVRQHRAEAAKAGISLEEALRHCCSAGWQGFRADWYLKDHGVGAGKGGALVNRFDQARGRDDFKGGIEDF